MPSLTLRRLGMSALVALTCLALSPANGEEEADRADLAPDDSVRVEICEKGVPEKQVWPEESLAATESYSADAFGFFRLPHKYIDTGLRADRANPLLIRARARVELPAGKHRLLLRGRGACRLWIDGKLLLTTPFIPKITDGHTPIPTDYLDLGPDFRFKPPGNREKWTTFTSTGATHTLLLETIIGGKPGGYLRPELGETVAAVSLEGSASFRLLSPKRNILYTDDGWAEYRQAEEKRLAALEAVRRNEAFQKSAAPWNQRRDLARKWLAATKEIDVPPLPAGYPAQNAVDHFLAVKLASISGPGKETGGRVDFHAQVKPILEAKCFSCHQGAKARGGLRLDSLEKAKAGGDSTLPAVVPGQPGKSHLLTRVVSKDEDEVMPPKGERLTEKEVDLLRQWIQEGTPWPRTQTSRLTALTDDLTFLRRVTLDTVGVVPTEAEIASFLADTRKDKRARRIDLLLADPRWADHWVGYWQDVLAENPNILNPTLNNTGPFRWWIHESFLDNKPIDLFATELIRMRGSPSFGGPAGFALATQNDAPMAEKAAIVASAFLGVQMKCARCHDAPGHRSTQKDLFQLAAALNQEPLTVPVTSSVPKDKLHEKGRAPLIKVTLTPGTKVPPGWPFPTLNDSKIDQDDSRLSHRDHLAFLITGPRNERFAQVIANRMWKRFMGRGLVEPVDDWEKGEATHPELLRYLGRELVRGEYDLKHLARLILNAHAYQRAADPTLKEPDAFHAAPARRRLSAEQIVDSLFLAAGKTMDTEEVNLDLDGGRDLKNSISLGKPRRAWMFASTSNERDRPSLALPRVQAVVDVLEAFGWRSARQFPLTDRETDPNVLQPAILANGTMTVWLTRLSDDHELTRLTLEDQPVERLVDRLFLRVLTREPRPDERAQFVAYLRAGYEQRIVKPSGSSSPPKRRPPRYVSWSNHLTEEANEIKIQAEAAARRGAPPTNRLNTAWRQRMEDGLWALLNDPEFLFRP